MQQQEQLEIVDNIPELGKHASDMCVAFAIVLFVMAVCGAHISLLGASAICIVLAVMTSPLYDNVHE